MSDYHKLLLTGSTLCVAAAWYVRSEDPTFKYAPIITVSVVAIVIYVYYKTAKPVNGRCKSTPNAHGQTGTCELDSDCNKVDPKGQCYKNDKGLCGCVCSNGYSGPNCETQGIPWNDPSCMGPNGQKPKNQSGLCVCPNPNWVSGTDPKFGYVQCLKCAGTGDNEWGPYASSGSPVACSAQWRQANVLSDVCVYNQTSNPSLYCADVAAQYENGYPNYKGDIPTVALAKINNNQCTGKSCKCSGDTFEYKIPTSRSLCAVTGWITPNVTTQTCADKSVNTERACSSYQCKGWTDPKK